MEEEDMLLQDLRRLQGLLEQLGYRPVVVGSYALVLQGWLPAHHLLATKDVDLYVDDPGIAFDERVEEKLSREGLPLSRSEAGGLYVESVKRIEILYPLHDIYIPPPLLKHTLTLKGLRVLEAHAVLVARALSTPQEEVLEHLRKNPRHLNPQRLRRLLEEAQAHLDPPEARLVEKRITRLLQQVPQTT